LVLQDDIVYELKAVKNACEIHGMKQAHVRIFDFFRLIEIKSMF
jgi:hypothetical protein